MWEDICDQIKCLSMENISNSRESFIPCIIKKIRYCVQGVQRTYGRICKYKAITQKVNNPALKFLIF